jgi:hypothetical protein
MINDLLLCNADFHMSGSDIIDTIADVVLENRGELIKVLKQ